MNSSNYFYQINIIAENGSVMPFHLDRKHYSIGCHPEACICLKELYPNHAELRFETGEWVIKKMNQDASLQFLGHALKMKKLNHQDMVHLGKVKLKFFRNKKETFEALFKDNKTSIDQDNHYLVQILDGFDCGQTYVIHDGEYIVGRKPDQSDNRIVIQDNYISDNHLRLILKNKRISIEELNRSDSQSLSTRDVQKSEYFGKCRIALGETTLVISLADEL